MNLVWAPVFLLLCAIGVTTVATGLHLWSRRRPQTERPFLHSLRQIAPRGGRARFPVRLVEIAVLGVVWTFAAIVLANLVALFDAVPKERQALFGVCGAMLVMGTWWAWRRGTLRDRASARFDDARNWSVE